MEAHSANTSQHRGHLYCNFGFYNVMHRPGRRGAIAPDSVLSSQLPSEALRTSLATTLRLPNIAPRMILPKTTQILARAVVVRVVPTRGHWRSPTFPGNQMRLLFHFGGRQKTWQRRWKHSGEGGDSESTSASVFIKSLSAGIVGVGVLLITWPLLDNIIAPVAVRAAMVAEPRGVEGLLAREEELRKLDALLDGTRPGIWVMDGVGKTTLLRMEQGRRPCMYFNLRETGSVNDLVYQLVNHLYQPLGGFGKLIVSYTQLVQASINLLGATDGDVFNSYNELFFSLYLSHLRRAIHGSSCTGPLVPFQPSQGLSFVMSAKQQQRQDRTPLLVLDHADVTLALGKASSEPGYQRLLDELWLLAGSVSQDTAAGQVIIVTRTDKREELEKRLAALGCSTRRLTVGGLSSNDTRRLVQGLAQQPGSPSVSEAELLRLEQRALRAGKGDPKLIQDLVARELWGGHGAAHKGRVAVGINADEASRESGSAAGMGLGRMVAAGAVLVAIGLARGAARSS